MRHPQPVKWRCCDRVRDWPACRSWYAVRYRSARSHGRRAGRSVCIGSPHTDKPAPVTRPVTARPPRAAEDRGASSSAFHRTDVNCNLRKIFSRDWYRPSPCRPPRARGGPRVPAHVPRLKWEYYQYVWHSDIGRGVPRGARAAREAGGGGVRCARRCRISPRCSALSLSLRLCSHRGR